MQETTQYIQEDTIDIKELFLVLKKRKKIIYSITFLFTLLAFVYLLIAKPVYEVRGLLELAQINQKPIDSATTLKQKIEAVFEVDIKNKKIIYPIVHKVTIPKNTKDLLLISVHARNNDDAISKLNQVFDYLKKNQTVKLDGYKEIQNKKLLIVNNDIVQNQKFIQKAKAVIKQYEDKLLNISKKDAALAGIYAIEISKKQTELNMAVNRSYKLKKEKNSILSSLSPYKLQETAFVGDIQVLDKPIKPKKLLIMIVAFITGLMFAVFLAFFLEFLRE